MNQQIGDGNKMYVNNMHCIEPDWQFLAKEFDRIEKRVKTNHAGYDACKKMIKSKNKKGLVSYIKEHFQELSESVFCNLIANAIIELWKLFI